MPAERQRYLFVGLGTAVSAFLAFALWRGVRSRIETAAYIGLMGGALGNVIDRLRIGAVVDYLRFLLAGMALAGIQSGGHFCRQRSGTSCSSRRDGTGGTTPATTTRRDKATTEY